MSEKVKHNKRLDEDRLAYAVDLINKLKFDDETTNAEILLKALTVMQFGGLGVQEMIDFLDATF